MARQLVGDVRRIASNQRAVHDIVLDTSHVFMRGSIVDTSVDALTGVLTGEIMSKIAIFSLIYFLVAIMSWSMTTMIAAGISTSAITTGHLVAVVVRQRLWRCTLSCGEAWLRRLRSEVTSAICPMAMIKCARILVQSP
jgi:hypothetical protein